MEPKILPFFEIERTLSDQERKELALFARSPSLKCGKKATKLLELLIKVPPGRRIAGNSWGWLKGELFPNEDDRNFRRTVKQAEDVYWQFLATKSLEKQPELRLELLLASLLQTPLDHHFKKKLTELETVLEDYRARDAGYFLHCYHKENLRRKFSAKQRKRLESSFGTTLKYLDQFYLVEKFKYAVFLLQLSKVEKEKFPDSLLVEMDFLTRHHHDVIVQTPVLQIYLLAYELNLEGEKQHTAEDWLGLLEAHSEKIPEEESRELYVLAGNFVIQKINRANFSLPDLIIAYKEYFRLNQLLIRSDLLREGEYIPQARFQNVVGSALNTGEAEDIEWAERFLEEYLPQVHPDDREDLAGFCHGAIHFYKKDYEACMKTLAGVRNVNRFYYCDIKSLELRTHYEYPLDYIDESQHIHNARRAIINDDRLSHFHRAAYLNFFELTGELFRIRDEGKSPKSKQLEILKNKIGSTHPLAQKKWLLEKMQELEKIKRYGKLTDGGVT